MTVFACCSVFFSSFIVSQSLVQLYVNFLWGTSVTEVQSAHLDTPRVRRRWSVSTGCEGCARRVISVSFCTRMIWQRCLSATFSLSLVSLHSYHYFYCSWMKIISFNLESVFWRELLNNFKTSCSFGMRGGKRGGGGNSCMISTSHF